MITINTPKDYLKFVVATFIISSVVWIAIDIYNTYQENYSDFDEQEEWITYTNTNYGYEISYPEKVEFIRSSELGRPKAKEGKEDQGVFIGDYSGIHIYNMYAGSPKTGYKATSSELLKEQYEKITIPEYISSELGEKYNLSKEDLKINEITFNNQPAV